MLGQQRSSHSAVLGATGNFEEAPVRSPRGTGCQLSPQVSACRTQL